MKLYLSNKKYSKSLEDYVKLLEEKGYKVSKLELAEKCYDPNIVVEVTSLKALLEIVKVLGTDLILTEHHKIANAYTIVARD